eukprot:scaffold1888_cov120-Cylindrotheca_fusiformis.AAC.6
MLHCVVVKRCRVSMNTSAISQICQAKKGVVLYLRNVSSGNVSSRKAHGRTLQGPSKSTHQRFWTPISNLGKTNFT